MIGAHKPIIDLVLSEENLRHGLDDAEVGLWALDLVDRTFHWSDAARRLFGGSAPANLEALLAPLAAEGRNPLREAVDRAVSQGTPFDLQHGIATPAGMHWVRLRGGIIRGPDGAPRLLGGVLMDIDDQKRLEEALRTRESHLRSILETIPDAMVVIDERGIMQSFSTAAERLFGYSSSEALGQNVSLLMPEPDSSKHDSYMARYRRTAEQHIIGIGRIVTGRRRDGTTFPMHLSIGEMNPGGDRYFTGFIRDLTEHQQTQARLQELQSELVHVSRLSAMGEMASALAHELNQPLAAISNYMKGSRRLLGASEDPSAAKIEVALDRAAEQAMRAGQIIRRLRSFVSRGESEKRVESVAKLVEEAGALGLTGAREQGVLLRFNLDPVNDLVLVDRVQIQQVLVNLFRNALDAMTQSPRRELYASSHRIEGDLIEVTISDTGSGFAEGVLPSLFQTFFTTKENGMGVGLSISRSIIEGHGGRLNAESNEFGGATFRFTLPAAPNEGAGIDG
ncbi:PAS domain S-box protein [Bradyrhizobium sp. WD16]|uniref:PAS domain-containing sensor histidine kinase n=1 Tax=Bradyrhizobium sp. WD16 TaxID=1521768 RepID=UPI0020A59849|nr:PAS domain S-box protein [Bradyrhizobium sp. WD16]